MTKPLIVLPCTVKQLHDAVYAFGIQHGLHDAKVRAEDVFEPTSDAPSYVSGITHKRVTRLVIETEEKEGQRFCGCCANKECRAKGAIRVVVCNDFK